MGRKYKVLVIIISYNFKRWIDLCLDSLRKSDYPADVIVIDNDSKDDTTNLINKNYPEVRLIETGKNLGFGRANNIGMKIALDEGYDFVFLLNQDAWIEPDTIGKLITAYNQTGKEYGIISPVHLNGAGDKLDKGFSTYAKVEYIKENEQSIIPVEFINAALWMLPRKTLEEIGGFSPLFRHYGEDIDYANRVKYRNLKIGYVPTASGYHDREYRTITEEAFLHSEFVFHLSEYANINHHFGKAFAFSILACIKKMVNKRRKGYGEIAWRILKNTNQVIETRKINKRKNRNHLF